MKKNLLYSAALLLCPLLLTANDGRFSYTQSAPGNHELTCVIEQPKIKTVMLNGTQYHKIIFNSGIHTQQKGFAELPFISASVILSPSNDASLEVTGGEYEDYPLTYPMLPSRGIIYRNQNPETIPYEIDPASVTDSWYPADLAAVSEPYIIRDVRGISVRVYPFQYNAKTGTFRVYKTMRITLREHSNTSTNPLKRVSSSVLREMDGMYRSLFINYPDYRESLTISEYGDLLVITTPRDSAAVEPYIQWKKEKGNNVFRELVAPNTNVKSLIQQKYSENPNLLYVQLIGDWADIKSDLGTSSNYPMDPQLGCVSGTDPVADICIGRFSASSSAEVTVQVEKTIAYEKNPDSSGAWYPRALGIASEEGPGDDNEIDYVHIGNIFNRKLHPFTYTAYDSVYEPNDNLSSVISSVQQGVSVINYTGHGSSSSWGTTGFSSANVNTLTNGSKLPFIISVACNNGQFHNVGSCFAETWLRKAGGGAVWMLASTISQPWDPPMRGQDYINDIITGGYNYSLYPGQSGISTDEQRFTAGSVVFNAFALMYTESGGSDDLETMQTWTIFGDVTLQFRTAVPENIYLTNRQTLVGVPFTTTVTGGAPVEGACVTLNQNGQTFRGCTDGNGSVTIHHALTAGPVNIIVTGFNLRTLSITDTVVNPDGPWITAELTGIADDSGNNNGYADFGETADLSIRAKNVGLDSAAGVTATLSSEDTLITIIDSFHVYGNILSDSSVTGEGGFRISVADIVPDQHRAECLVTMSDDSGRVWQSSVFIPLSAPSFSFLSVIIDDNLSGDHDGILDPGETADICVNMKNTGHASAGLTLGRINNVSPLLNLFQDSAWADSLYPGDTVMMKFTVAADSAVLPGTPVSVVFHAEYLGYTVNKEMTIVIGLIPEYLMKNGVETVSNGKFFDTGGKTGKYQNNENFILTLMPQDTAKNIRVSFTSFKIEEDWDYLYVYDGPDTNAAQITGSPFTGTSITPVITSGHGTGALTFRFYSDVYLTDDGWEAGISCVSLISMDDRETTVPGRFELSQNYPNPFNPTTSIRFTLPTDRNVSLKIYNSLGQEVADLVKGFRKAGKHSVVWNGRDTKGRAVGTGLYLYRIHAGEFTETRKMLLLK